MLSFSSTARRSFGALGFVAMLGLIFMGGCDPALDAKRDAENGGSSGGGNGNAAKLLLWDRRGEVSVAEKNTATWTFNGAIPTAITTETTTAGGFNAAFKEVNTFQQTGFTVEVSFFVDSISGPVPQTTEVEIFDVIGGKSHILELTESGIITNNAVKPTGNG